ncbi:MAG: patatin-like phospholipase family protein [Phycisphaeraceae bacterium]|nr:patatin-like phospholipase family protein [Phycisphaeraceae bacterium]
MSDIREATPLNGATDDGRARNRRLLALGLSGGGFRAMLFHIGALRAVRAAGLLRAPNRLDYVASVSGGSILAAHLALRWSDYCSEDEKQFKDACGELIALAQRDVRGRLVRRLAAIAVCQILYGMAWAPLKALRRLFPDHAHLLPDRPTTTRWLESEYARFFRKAARRKWMQRGPVLSDLSACADPGSPELPPCPNVDIIATNLTYGCLCTFSADGLALRADRPTERCARDLHVSTAVAASSAFPAMFPPVEFDRRRVAHWDRAIDVQFATDGGAMDNLGRWHLERWWHDAAAPGDEDGLGSAERLVLLSDASSSMSISKRRVLGWALPATLRTIDLLVQQQRSLQHEVMRSQLSRQDAVDRERPAWVIAAIGHKVSRSPCPQNMQALLGHLRTDLDRFSPCEIVRLVEHGYCVMAEQLRATGFAFDDPVNASDWPVAGYERSRWEGREVAVLDGGSQRRLRLFSLSDPGAIALACVLLATAVAIGVVASAWIRTPDVSMHADASRRIMAAHLAHEPILLVAQEAPVVEHSIDTKYEHVEILADDRLFDLRAWARFTPSVVSAYRSMSVRKRAPGETLVMRFETSGENLWLRGRSREGVRYHALPGRQGEGTTTALVRWVVFDLPGGGDPLDAHVVASYVGAFEEPRQHWVGARITDRTRSRLTLGLVFPKEEDLARFNLGPGRRYAEIRRRVEIRADVEREQPQQRFHDATDVGTLVAPVDGEWLLWWIDDPEPDRVYRLEWQWDLTQDPVWEIDK